MFGLQLVTQIIKNKFLHKMHVTPSGQNSNTLYFKTNADAAEFTDTKSPETSERHVK